MEMPRLRDERNIEDIIVAMHAGERGLIFSFPPLSRFTCRRHFSPHRRSGLPGQLYDSLHFPPLKIPLLLDFSRDISPRNASCGCCHSPRDDYLFSQGCQPFSRIHLLISRKKIFCLISAVEHYGCNDNSSQSAPMKLQAGRYA